MKKTFRPVLSLLMALLLSCALALPVLAAPAGEGKTATILFTHDMHSHLLPAPKEGGGEYGGYGRLMTALKTERAAAERAGIPSITIDGGDFSMGSLFQTVYTSEALELRSLGLLGVDVTTFGNHEYEYRADGLAKMLEAALASGDPLPKIVQCNYITPKDPAADAAVVKAMDDYGVTDYVMIEKDGVRFAVFGVLGVDADECAPMSGMVLQDVTASAQRVVDAIQANEDYDFILCCSHSGTNPDPKKSEDELLAKAVNGIDFIVSGHTHSTLEAPKIVNNTVIGCVGEYCTNLGKVTISKASDGTNTVLDYELIPIDENVKGDAAMSARVESFKTLVEQDYLSQFGMTYDQVLCYSPFDFTPLSHFAAEQEEDPLGSLIADAYIYAVEQAEGGAGAHIDAAFVNSGLIRATIAKGDITVANAFDISSIGSGADGTPGYPLIDVYLTGRELKNVFEVDPSVGPIFAGAQLYGSRVKYGFNMHRMLFNRMTDPAFVRDDGSTSPIDDDKLYRVVTNLYSSQMLGTVTEKSFGILKITPKDENGQPITDYEARVIHMPNGGEVKEWYSVASYLSSFPQENGVPQMLSRYAQDEGRKVRSDSWSPIALLRQPNWVTLLVVAIVLVLLALVVFLVYRIATRKKRRVRKAQRHGGRPYKNYRG